MHTYSLSQFLFRNVLVHIPHYGIVTFFDDTPEEGGRPTDVQYLIHYLDVPIICRFLITENRKRFVLLCLACALNSTRTAERLCSAAAAPNSASKVPFTPSSYRIRMANGCILVKIHKIPRSGIETRTRPLGSRA